MTTATLSICGPDELRFFSYDPDGKGFRLHGTMKEALSASESALDDVMTYLPPDEQAESARGICWGVISGRACLPQGIIEEYLETFKQTHALENPKESEGRLGHRED